MCIKTLKKIAGVLFSISINLKAIRKVLDCQNKPLIIKGEFKPFETIEEFQKYINSHKWIEDYIDERLAAKSREVERIKAIRKTLEKQEINHS